MKAIKANEYKNSWQYEAEKKQARKEAKNKRMQKRNRRNNIMGVM